ncbi:MerR family transcriptional regulator [Amycolatopsis sp., V23-08]|uniref:MerR family transcriptional regulator n=1 Tax=Amycolatopsis heterodermiae TaxID=3110235 RepID=A0ABU5QXR4_9PSEU|nr:MerR family transcriptional regulator [Amycolatopsis sp., V23-08]MEA5358219.1 MerR family transcriptional regulator [Amycolatopsis sp., V23-08]
MRIGELAERTGVSTRLLRYYEEQGLLAASRDANGYRCYDGEAVVRVRQIRRLLAAGLNTEVIGSALQCARGEEARLDLCPELAQVLHRELTAMDDRIGTLQRRRRALAGYLTEEGGRPPARYAGRRGTGACPDGGVPPGVPGSTR